MTVPAAVTWLLLAVGFCAGAAFVLLCWMLNSDDHGIPVDSEEVTPVYEPKVAPPAGMGRAAEQPVTGGASRAAETTPLAATSADPLDDLAAFAHGLAVLDMLHPGAVRVVHDTVWPEERSA